MPWHRHIPVSEFAPKAWAAMCELLGGEERISEKEEYRGWSDGFIVNLGREGYLPDDTQDLRGMESVNSSIPTFGIFIAGFSPRKLSCCCFLSEDDGLC